MIPKRARSLDPFEEDYITFNIEEISGKFFGTRTFLLYHIKENDEGKEIREDFLITEDSLRKILRLFPAKNNSGNRPSVLHEYGCIKILREIYAKIIGTYLKPMDTEF